MNFLSQIFIREIKRLKKRPAAIVMLILIPTVVFFYLGSIYEKGAIQTVDIAVQDLDHSDLSRKMIRNIEAAPKLKIIKFLNSEDELSKVFINNPDIKGVYLIPKDFSRNIFLGKQEKLVVYTNSSNIIYGNLLYKEAATFINTISAGINLNAFKLKGIPHKKAEKMIMPIKVISRPLFNSYYNYLYYLLPGLTTVLLQMIVFFLAARSLNSEFNDGTFAEVFELSGGSIFKLITGKLLTYSVLGFMVGIVIFAFVHPLLGVPMSENTLPFLGVVLIFVMTNVMLGMMTSAIFVNEAIAMDMSFVYNSPAFVFSGFTFPIMAMPAFEAWYAKLIPYTHFLKAFTKGISMNTPMAFLNRHVISLLIFFLVAYIVTVVVMQFRIKKQAV